MKFLSSLALLVATLPSLEANPTTAYTIFIVPQEENRAHCTTNYMGMVWWKLEKAAQGVSSAYAGDIYPVDGPVVNTTALNTTERRELEIEWRYPGGRRRLTTAWAIKCANPCKSFTDYQMCMMLAISGTTSLTIADGGVCRRRSLQENTGYVYNATELEDLEDAFLPALQDLASDTDNDCLGNSTLLEVYVTATVE
jgi:hypothetical protein